MTIPVPTAGYDSEPGSSTYDPHSYLCRVFLGLSSGMYQEANPQTFTSFFPLNMCVSIQLILTCQFLLPSHYAASIH